MMAAQETEPGVMEDAAATSRSGMNWYALQVAPASEDKIMGELRERIGDLQEDFGEIFVPTEEVVERKQGKEQITKRKFFPNYMFIEMRMTPENWHLVTRMPRIKGFVGDPNKRGPQLGDWKEPNPIPDADISKLRSRVKEGTEKPRPKIMFDKGEQVRVKAGPFADFNGEVASVNFEQNRITVLVNVFSKSTPVEIDFEQVEKL